jgi:hypothetical protein
MDATGPQRWDNERGDPAARRRAGILAQREREQSRDPVLGGRAGDDYDVVDYDKLYQFNYNNLHDLLHNDKYNGSKHHHHNLQRVDDILVHDDDFDDPCGLDDHVYVDGKYNGLFDIYGPVNHDH